MNFRFTWVSPWGHTPKCLKHREIQCVYERIHRHCSLTSLLQIETHQAEYSPGIKNNIQNNFIYSRGLLRTRGNEIRYKRWSKYPYFPSTHSSHLSKKCKSSTEKMQDIDKIMDVIKKTLKHWQFCPVNIKKYFCSCTYIHNWSFQPFSQHYGLASHNTHVVCVNFISEWRDIQFNVNTEGQIIERNFFYSQCFWQKSSERK